MAFRDFTYPHLLQTLHLRVTSTPDLFAAVPPSPASPALRETLVAHAQLAVMSNTEMTRAAFLVAPILGEFWRRYAGRVSLFSGVEFAADPDDGLTGYCDFLIGLGPQQPAVVAPVAVIFEAKRDNINDGLGQCIAGVVGAHRFNLREGRAVETVYGGLTTGTNWRFLSLSRGVITFDMTEYPVAAVDKLLGILMHMVGPVPEPAAA